MSRFAVCVCVLAIPVPLSLRTPVSVRVCTRHYDVLYVTLTVSRCFLSHVCASSSAPAFCPHPTPSVCLPLCMPHHLPLHHFAFALCLVVFGDVLFAAMVDCGAAGSMRGLCVCLSHLLRW